MGEIIEMIGELFLTGLITKKKGWFIAFFVTILGLGLFMYLTY